MALIAVGTSDLGSKVLPSTLVPLFELPLADDSPEQLLSDEIVGFERLAIIDKSVGWCLRPCSL